MIKEEKGSIRPALHLAYIMLASNSHELQDVVTLAKRLEAKQIVCSNLSLIIDGNLLAEALFISEEKRRDLNITLGAVAEKPRVVTDYYFCLIHLLDFLHNRPQYRRIGHNMLFGFGRPQNIGLYQDFFAGDLHRKKLKDFIDSLPASIIVCRFYHHTIHGFSPIYISKIPISSA